MGQIATVTTKRGGKIKGEVAGNYILVTERRRRKGKTYTSKRAYHLLKKKPSKPPRRGRQKEILQRGAPVKRSTWINANIKEGIKQRRRGKRKTRKEIQELTPTRRPRAKGEPPQGNFTRILVTFKVLNRYGERETWNQTYEIPPSTYNEARGYIPEATDTMIDSLPTGVEYINIVNVDIR